MRIERSLCPWAVTATRDVLTVKTFGGKYLFTITGQNVHLLARLIEMAPRYLEMYQTALGNLKAAHERDETEEQVILFEKLAEIAK
jgi:hypothetical protein